VEDVAAMRLVLDNLQAEQAKKELKGAEDVLSRVARECYKWLLCPSQDDPTGRPTVEAVPLNTSGAALGPELERVCLDNEWVITTWSPIHLRTKLKELYWKAEKSAVKAADFWEDTLRYIYLPRLKERNVLEQAIVKGASTRDFFATAYGQTGGKYEGFKLGEANVQFDDTLLLLEPEAAQAHTLTLVPEIVPAASTSPDKPQSVVLHVAPEPSTTIAEKPAVTSQPPKAKSFFGSADIAPAAAKMRLVQISGEIIALLTADPNAEVKVRLEIEANFPKGAQDQTKRAVAENSKTLGFNIAEWES